MAKRNSNKGRAVDTLDTRFDFEETFLASPDKVALKSALIHAREIATDEPIVLKYWEKTGAAIDEDLKELWKHEMRQSERVRAYPGADEVVVEISGSGETADAFYIALPGDLAPLDHAAKFVRGSHWLQGLGAPRHRLVLWRNIRRLALALGAVHGQGLVHGRIDQRAVFTSGATSEPDFKLGGFEFCLRIADLGDAPLAAIGRSRTAGPVVFSFMGDWRAVGYVAIGLLGLNPSQLFAEEPGFLDGRQTVDLRAAELDFLRLLIHPERNRALDAKVAVARIDSIIDDLSAEALAGNGRYVLALRLGEQSKLSAALAIASRDLFDTDDIDRQMVFVRADLEAGAQIARTVRGEMLIVTETLVYSLTPYRTPESGETWAIATTNAARPREQANYGRLQLVPLQPHRIEIVRYGAAASRLRELRGDALDWSGAFDAGAGEDATVPVRRGLLLAQIAEALFKAADIVPVDVVTQPRRQGDRTIVDLSPSDAEVRLRLNDALRIPNPNRVMQRLFQHEDADFDAEWQLSDSGSLGGTARASADVRFVRTTQKQNRLVYEFQVTSGVVPPHTQLYLRKSDDNGTDQALKRRLRMLTHLGTHAELATILGDPRSRLRTYRDEKLEEDDFFRKLDQSKQEALRSIWTNGPNQFVVGPPGVGKTTLVTEAVRRKIADDGTARILVSAQAHQALDHIAAAVQKVLSKAGLADDTILVRSKADNGADLSGVQTPERAKAFLQELERSPLVRAAPVTIRRDIAAMRAAADETGDLRTKLDRAILRQRRSFEALVLQSANILFSTVNSGDLERLVEDGAQFDWAIIEEAAKATGPELLAPQLLSMRRLLIGDHNQLPPFDTDRIDEFLADQTRVTEALRECDSVVGSIFRDFGLDELRDALVDEMALSETCAMARRMLLLFEGVVKVEIERQKRSDQRRRTVATELLQQHRMHPAIARVISECFYESKLQTDKDRAEEFDKDTPPFTSFGNHFPKSPIVFIDLPYIQTESGAEEERPTYHNTAERQAVLSVLKMFQAAPKNGKHPTLAVLSPYNEQTERLGLAITDRLEGELKNLADFRTAPNAEGFASTVDSFQGSEADLVVVSLVRNNDHVGKQALGILRDRRRMNVLLSRAKWQIVIVGSLEFLQVQGRRYKKRPDNAEKDLPIFLARMIELFDTMQKERLADGKTPKLTVLPIKSLVMGDRP